MCISQNVTWLFNDQDMEDFYTNFDLCSAVGQIIPSTVLTPKPERAVSVSLAHVQNTQPVLSESTLPGYLCMCIFKLGKFVADATCLIQSVSPTVNHPPDLYSSQALPQNATRGSTHGACFTVDHAEQKIHVKFDHKNKLYIISYWYCGFCAHSSFRCLKSVRYCWIPNAVLLFSCGEIVHNGSLQRNFSGSEKNSKSQRKHR